MKTDRPRELMQDCSPVSLAVCGWGQSYDVCTQLVGHPDYESCNCLSCVKAWCVGRGGEIALIKARIPQAKGAPYEEVGRVRWTWSDVVYSFLSPGFYCLLCAKHLLCAKNLMAWHAKC